MEILKALELNEETIEVFELDGRQECADAVKLSNEALKREQTHREGLVLTKPKLLPGETPAESKQPRKGHPITRLPIRKER